MDAAKEVEQESEGAQTNCGGFADEQHEDKPNQPKSRSVPEFLGLSRCAACYNHERSSVFRRGGDGESSSSAEDSGPEAEAESEAESSSSSSDPPSSETSESAAFVCGDAAEPAGGDGDGRGEAGETSEDKSEKRRVIKRAPLVKSSSLPSSFASRLPRPHTVVSTLRLQVLSKKRQDDAAAAAFCIVRQHLSEGEGSENGPTGSLPPPPTGLPWQQPTSRQHQPSYQHRPFPPLSAQGQRLPPPPHTLPVFRPPPLYAPPPQPCWFCYGGHWSHYGNGQFPR